MCQQVTTRRQRAKRSIRRSAFWTRFRSCADAVRKFVVLWMMSRTSTQKVPTISKPILTSADPLKNGPDIRNTGKSALGSLLHYSCLCPSVDIESQHRTCTRIVVGEEGRVFGWHRVHTVEAYDKDLAKCLAALLSDWYDGELYIVVNLSAVGCLANWMDAYTQILYGICSFPPVHCVINNWLYNNGKFVQMDVMSVRT